MCTDLRLIRLADTHVSARTLDFAFELGSQVRVVPRGQSWAAMSVPDGHSLAWTNSLGYVALNAFGFPDYYADGLNEAGLSVGTLWLPETDLTHTPPPGSGPAIDFLNLAGWLLGACRSVAEARAALESVRIWNPPTRALWPADRPVPDQLRPLLDWAATEHLSIHDAAGNDLVVEFTDGTMNCYDNHAGVLTNAPTYPWHVTNLRNFIGLTTVEDQPYNLMGMPVRPTGNGSGLIGLPGDVTPPSRFVRATVLTQTVKEVRDTRDAVNQAFHSLDLVSVPRHLAASGDYTQWYLVRDHDNRVLYVRSYDGWTTDVHVLADLGLDQPGAPIQTLALPS